MTLEELKNKVNQEYNIDISERNRRRHYAYARKVYCKLAREMRFKCEDIGNTIGLKHDMAIYHKNTFNVVTEDDKLIYNKIIVDNHLNIDIINIPKPKEIVLPEPISYKESLLLKIQKNVMQWNDEQINNFIETRLLPYTKLIESAKQPEVKRCTGAKLIRKHKNPFLSY